MFLYQSRSRHFPHNRIEVRRGATRCSSTELAEGGGVTRLRPFRDRVGGQLFLALVAGLLIELLSGGTALAASPFTVNDATDIEDATIGDGVCATKMGTCTLRAAIQEANALGSGTTATQQTITVPAGTYKLDIAGKGEDDAAAGDLDIKANVTINGAAANSTIIDAAQKDRVLDVLIGATVEIVAISITGGLIDQGGSFGAGIQNRGQLTLDSVTVNNNVTSTFTTLSGGGIYNHPGASLTLRKVVVSGNIIHGSGGGAGIENGGLLKANNSTISENDIMRFGSRGSGGGILNTSQGTAELSDTTVSGNKAYRGGGIHLHSGSMTLINSTISGNDAEEEGGAIYASSDFRIVNSTVAFNKSGGPTGATPLCNPCPSIFMLSGTATFRSTIIDQGASGCGGQSTNFKFISEGFNIDRGTSCGLAMQVTLCPWPAPAGGDLQNVDPRLQPLARNRGVTQTHALLDRRSGGLASPSPSSPAIDRVPAYYAPATDQRGISRPQYPPCAHPPCFYAPCGPWADVGAYEAESTTSQIVILNGLRPRSAKILTENLVLQVEGEGFLPGATVYWNWTPLPTEVRDSTFVEAVVKPEMFPRCGDYPITARNPDTDPSNPLSFHVFGCGRPLVGRSEGE
jgi:CSLREA domain-containing protein